MLLRSIWEFLINFKINLPLRFVWTIQTSEFRPSERDKLDGHALNSTTPRASQASILRAAREINN